LAGSLDGPVLSTTCSPATANVIKFADSRVYKCFAQTSTGHQGEFYDDRLSTGYPFIATIYARTRKIAWCKQNPHPDEKGDRGFLRVRMSPVCAGKLAQVL
jgi:hypothetical protein